MKKKVFAVVISLVILIAAMTVTASAYDMDLSQMYEYNVDIVYCNDSAKEVGQGEAIYPIGYFTTYTNVPSDKATRTYYQGFQTNLEGIHFNALLNTNVYSLSKEVTEGDSIAYTFTRDILDTPFEGINYSFDPFSNVTYDTEKIKLIITYNDFEYHDKSMATIGTTHIGNEVGGFEAYTLHLNSVGTVKVTMDILFTDSTTETTRGRSQSYDFVVDYYTDLDKEYYEDGYRVGYAEGYNKGLSDGYKNTEEWSFIGFVNAIVQAPFNFLRTCFDFTIFGVNVYNAIRTITTLAIVVAVGMFVVRLLL